jgi:hypothetical protein
MLEDLLDRKTNDVFRYVHIGDLQRATFALGAVESIKEMLRLLEHNAEVNARLDQIERDKVDRKQPGRVPVIRGRKLIEQMKKESVNE